MKIKYMQQLKDNPTIGGGYTIEGFPESQIKVLELKYNKGKKFPLAFREYLEIAGRRGGTGAVDNDFDDLFNDLQEDMEYFNEKLDRPFFVFNHYSGYYSIFFLDKQEEDPDTYILTPFGNKSTDPETVFFKKSNHFNIQRINK